MVIHGPWSSLDASIRVPKCWILYQMAWGMLPGVIQGTMGAYKGWMAHQVNIQKLTREQNLGPIEFHLKNLILMLVIDRDIKPTHFLDQNDTPSSSKVNFCLSSMIYETVPTRVHPGKSPISCTNVVILSSEVKILLPLFFVCKDEWLGHNAHRIL